MKFLPNIIPAAVITHHHGSLLLLVATFTTVLLRFSFTPTVFHQHFILKETEHYYMSMVIFQKYFKFCINISINLLQKFFQNTSLKNLTCLSTIKQLQYRLTRTRFKCVSLEKISTEDNCQKWIVNSHQLYTELASKKRLQNCDTYFANFPTAARRPVSFT